MKIEPGDLVFDKVQRQYGRAKSLPRGVKDEVTVHFGTSDGVGVERKVPMDDLEKLDVS